MQTVAEFVDIAQAVALELNNPWASWIDTHSIIDGFGIGSTLVEPALRDAL
jgi:hypothetical protein